MDELAQFCGIGYSAKVLHDFHIVRIQLISLVGCHPTVPLEPFGEELAFFAYKIRLYLMHVVKDSSKWFINSASNLGLTMQSSIHALIAFVKLRNNGGMFNWKYAAVSLRPWSTPVDMNVPCEAIILHA